MNADDRSPANPYRPRHGELVTDLGNGGRRGVYMGRLGKRAYLRPAGGGIEWETDPSKIEPLPGTAVLETVSRRSSPRREGVITLPGQLAGG
ncbi:hypothetical protein [Streptomyces tateyamensis]|uniref:hypothetical protein n=1 Tax=Streptomyces tateyamensis TaxID=565073 RepID=UPI0011B6CD4F|nr:hypothetical protein [Streptomyces tateyamensis]